MYMTSKYSWLFHITYYIHKAYPVMRPYHWDCQQQNCLTYFQWVCSPHLLLNTRQHLSTHWTLSPYLLHPHHSYCGCYGYEGANWCCSHFKWGAGTNISLTKRTYDFQALVHHSNAYPSHNFEVQQSIFSSATHCSHWISDSHVHSTWANKLPQRLQRLQVPAVCIPAHKQGLYADAYPSTFRDIYQMSHVQKGISECSITLKTLKEGSCHPNHGGWEWVNVCSQHRSCDLVVPDEQCSAPILF